MRHLLVGSAALLVVVLGACPLSQTPFPEFDDAGGIGDGDGDGDVMGDGDGDGDGDGNVDGGDGDGDGEGDGDGDGDGPVDGGDGDGDGPVDGGDGDGGEDAGVDAGDPGCDSSADCDAGGLLTLCVDGECVAPEVGCENVAVLDAERNQAGRPDYVPDLIIDPDVTDNVTCTLPIGGTDQVFTVVPTFDEAGSTAATNWWVVPSVMHALNDAVVLDGISVSGDLSGTTVARYQVQGSGTVALPNNGETVPASFHLFGASSLSGLTISETDGTLGAAIVVDGANADVSLTAVHTQSGLVGVMVLAGQVSFGDGVIIGAGNYPLPTTGLLITPGAQGDISWMGTGGEINAISDAVIIDATDANTNILFGDENVPNSAPDMTSDGRILSLCSGPAGGGVTCNARISVDGGTWTRSGANGEMVTVGPDFAGTLDIADVSLMGAVQPTMVVHGAGTLSVNDVTGWPSGAFPTCGDNQAIDVRSVAGRVSVAPLHDDGAPNANRFECVNHTSPAEKYFDNALSIASSIAVGPQPKPPRNQPLCTGETRCMPGGLARMIDTGFESCAGVEFTMPNSPLDFECLELDDGGDPHAYLVSVALHPGRGLADLITYDPGQAPVWTGVSYTVTYRPDPMTDPITVATSGGPRPWWSTMIDHIDGSPDGVSLSANVVHTFEAAAGDANFPEVVGDANIGHLALVDVGSPRTTLQLPGGDAEVRGDHVWLEMNLTCGTVEAQGGAPDRKLYVTGWGVTLSKLHLFSCPEDSAELLDQHGPSLLLRDSRLSQGQTLINLAANHMVVTRSHLSNAVDNAMRFTSTMTVSDLTVTRTFMTGINNQAIYTRQSDAPLARSRFMGITLSDVGDGYSFATQSSDGPTQTTNLLQQVIISNTGKPMGNSTYAVYLDEGHHLFVVDTAIIETRGGMTVVSGDATIEQRGLFGFDGVDADCTDGMSGQFNLDCLPIGPPTAPFLVISNTMGTHADNFEDRLGQPPDTAGLTLGEDGSVTQRLPWEAWLNTDLSNTNNVNACYAEETCATFSFRLEQGVNPAPLQRPDGLQVGFANNNWYPPAAVVDFEAGAGQGSQRLDRGLIEIVDDIIGDNDGRCEADERCLIAPHLGAWQGEDVSYSWTRGPRVILDPTDETQAASTFTHDPVMGGPGGG